jgi:hypothetical protein
MTNTSTQRYCLQLPSEILGFSTCSMEIVFSTMINYYNKLFELILFFVLSYFILAKLTFLLGVAPHLRVGVREKASL